MNTVKKPEYIEDLEQMNSHALSLRMQNGTTTMENCLAVSFKSKHIPDIWSIPRLIPKINESLCSYKDLYTNVHNSLFVNIPNWKQHESPSTDYW